MSELKAFNMPRYAGEFTMHEVYLKSEADKVIADLEESHKMEVEQLLIEIAELKAQKAQAEDDCAYWKTMSRKNADDNEVMAKRRADAFKRERHHKYKRCLAMAGWCEATALWCYPAANTLPTGFQATLFGKPVMIEPDRLFYRFERLIKWSNRWMNLAKKFKETK